MEWLMAMNLKFIYLHGIYRPAPGALAYKSIVTNTGGFLGEYIPAWDTWRLVPAALVYTSVVAYSEHTLVGTA